MSEKNPSHADQQEQKWRSLMIASQEGDKRSYQTLLAEIQAPIRRFLITKLGSQTAVDDILQETLIAIHKARHTYDSQRKFTPWMISLAKYKYVDYLRKWSRREAKEVSDDQLLNHLIATEPAHPANTGLGEEMQAALAKLPIKQRMTIELLKIEGLSVKEVSMKTGDSESAVKVNAHRGYKAIRKHFERLRYEDG